MSRVRVRLAQRDGRWVVERDGVVCDLGLTLADGDAGETLARAISTRVEEDAVPMSADGSFSCGTWPLRFQRMGSGLQLAERDAEGEWRVGVARALELWTAQQAVAQQWGSPMTPPRADQLIAVSAGVDEGDVLEGIRYSAPAHMSGWYLTTDRYDGNIRSLRLVHAWHVVVSRPDIAAFLGLGPGFFFRTRADGLVEVGRDPEDDS